MDPVRMHYVTVGAPRKDNVVLILHGTGGSSKQFLNDHFAGVPLPKLRSWLTFWGNPDLVAAAIKKGDFTADEYDPFAYSRPTAAEGKPGTCEEIRAAQDALDRVTFLGFRRGLAAKASGFGARNPDPV